MWLCLYSVSAPVSALLTVHVYADGTNVVAGQTLGTLPQVIDSDNVCSSSSEGFVYVQNTCSTPVSATVKVRLRSLLIWAQH